MEHTEILPVKILHVSIMFPVVAAAQQFEFCYFSWSGDPRGPKTTDR